MAEVVQMKRRAMAAVASSILIHQSSGPGPWKTRRPPAEASIHERERHSGDSA
jgi:hypothetical protein